MARHCRLPWTQMSPERSRSRNASRVAASQVRRWSVLFSPPLSRTASRQAGRRKLVGGFFGHFRPLPYVSCSTSTARSVAAAAGTARNWKASRNTGPSRCSTGQARVAKASRSTLSGCARRSASATLAASVSHPTDNSTAPSRSASPSLAAINAAPSLANRRTLSLAARASRSTASSSRASARRNIRPTARSNRPMPSSVRRAVVSSTVATRVALRRSNDSARRCWAVKRSPSRASLRSRSGCTPSAQAGSRPMARSRVNCWTMRSRALWPGAPGGCRAQASVLMEVPFLGSSRSSSALAWATDKAAVSCPATWRSATTRVAATRRSTTLGPGAMIRRRRNSSISVSSDRHGVGGGQRHGQQPGKHVAALSGSEHAKAERFTQPIKLLAPGLGPGCISSKRIGADAKLAGDELQGCLRNDLAWPKQPSRVAEGAKLQGIAELVVPATAALDHGQVGCTQSPVADQVRVRLSEKRAGFRAALW